MTDAGLMSALPADVAAGPEWLVGLRRDAAARLRETGFPGKKNEAWRFTSVKSVVDAELGPATPDLERARGAASFAEGHVVVVADGAAFEVGDAPEGVTVSRLSERLDAARGVLGEVADRAWFAGLNAALFADGLLVEVTGVAEAPLQIVHATTSGGAAYPRIVVLGRANSQATIVETFVDAGGEDASLVSSVCEIALEDGARLDHVRVTEGSARASRIGRLAVRQGRSSRYASRVVALGGALERLDLTVRFEGPGAECELDGVYHVDGTDHVDHQVRVTHAAPHCTSHVRYRGLLDGQGHAVFDAIGIADRDAVGTSAHQKNENLLLSGEARLNTKPHLEIDTDDIAASHGATVGALDATQLFYLRSRGIPERDARGLLTFAFVQALLDRIPHAPTRARCSEALVVRLHGEPTLLDAAVKEEA